jgi:hypothetical protein
MDRQHYFYRHFRYCHADLYCHAHQDAERHFDYNAHADRNTDNYPVLLAYDNPDNDDNNDTHTFYFSHNYRDIHDNSDLDRVAVHTPGYI